jgi:uncharacterized protein (TIGR00251 family)
MSPENLKLSIKVHPGASKNELTGFKGDVLHIKVTARPEKGRANSALIDFLSDVFGIAKSRISIVRGGSSHDKVIEIEGMDLHSIRQIIH